MRLRIVSVVAVALLVGLIAGCGGGSTSSAPASQTNRGRQLLESWSAELTPTFRALNVKDDHEVLEHLPRIEKFGGEARKAFKDDEPSDVTRAAIESGDSWTAWAHTLRTDPPAGDATKARHVADLGTKAVRDYRNALQAVGVDPDTIITP
jgi:hypothetical protein